MRLHQRRRNRPPQQRQAIVGRDNDAELHIADTAEEGGKSATHRKMTVQMTVQMTVRQILGGTARDTTARQIGR